MSTIWRSALTALLLAVLGTSTCNAVQLKISRDSLQRTLKQQLVNAPNGRFYLKGTPQTPCYAYAEDPQLLFDNNSGRLVVRVKIAAKLGKQWGNSCLGVNLTLPTEVTLAPDGQGEMVGFKDAKLTKISDHSELNFLLTPFLSHQVPKSMQINAADLMRKALAGSTANSGFKVTLEKLNIHFMQIQGDNLVVDGDGDIQIQ